MSLADSAISGVCECADCRRIWSSRQLKVATAGPSPTDEHGGRKFLALTRLKSSVTVSIFSETERDSVGCWAYMADSHDGLWPVRGARKKKRKDAYHPAMNVFEKYGKWQSGEFHLSCVICKCVRTVVSCPVRRKLGCRVCRVNWLACHFPMISARSSFW